MTTTKLTDWKNSGEFVTFSAGDIFVNIQGSGPALVLLHGFPTSSWDWHKVVAELAKNYRVLTFDMLGYGFSDKPLDGDYSTAAQARLVFDLLSQNNISKFHLMAYSYGSSVAQEILHQQAQQNACVLSLCLLNGGLFPGSNHPRLAQRLLLGKLGSVFVKLFNQKSLKRNLSAIFGLQTQPSDELIGQYWSLINHKNGKRVFPKLIQYLKERQEYGPIWEKALKQATCPIQLIIGDHDSISGIEVAEEFAAKVSKENIHVLPGIGHYPQIEAPETMLKLYTEFQQTYNFWQVYY